MEIGLSGGEFGKPAYSYMDGTIELKYAKVKISIKAIRIY